MMGYYTHHTLHIAKDDADEDFVQGLGLDRGYAHLEICEPAIDGCVSFQQEEQSKWYEHTEELLVVSRAHPDILFVLDGDGEEQGDIWREFFLNGRTYRWELGEVTRPPFNADHLRQPGEEG